MTRRALVAVLALAACARVRPVVEHPVPPPQGTFAQQVRPVLESRCVVCHACYDSPCQLNQQTWEGIDRGATTARVYEPSRLQAIAPTRMFQDAQSTATWRTEFKFFPVVSHGGNPADSVLHHFLAHRRADPRGGDFDPLLKQECPDSVDAARAYLKKRPEAGMPYGMPPLSDAEFGAIEAWLAEGAPPPPAAKEADPGTRAQWETFFNQDDLRVQLVARYLYEHLFLAHLHFGEGSRGYYRLVRSRTAPGTPVQELVTVRPFDDPKADRVFYRLVLLTETIVRKTHAPFALTAKKRARWTQLFLASDWTVTALPSFEPEVAGNPFVAFAAIPPRARYQFMLDDAGYHVRAFIHGPVCRGQVALNVIDEQFWILFVAPDADPTVNDPAFLRTVAPHLRVPAEGGDGLEAIYERFKSSQLSYTKARAALHTRALPKGRSLDALWDGDGHNPDALLTVYRHFDSASVARGPLGAVPKTGWVLDYPLFERIYYDLVAGFNVFGSLTHQVSTRRYMDNLRIEAEDGFLQFLPKAERLRLRADWYRGPGVAAYIRLIDPSFDHSRETQVVFVEPARAKQEFWDQVKAKLAPAVVGTSRAPDVALRAIADVPAAFVDPFPDLTLLRVGDEVFSLARNKAHLNVAFMFLEDAYRAPQEDTLDVVRGFTGSYPNLFLQVPPEKLAQLVGDLKALRARDDAGWQRFLDTYGVRRNAPEFWKTADWFNAAQRRVEPVEGGLFDLSRYVWK